MTSSSIPSSGSDRATSGRSGLVAGDRLQSAQDHHRELTTTRRRLRSARARRDRWSGAAIGLGFLVAALGWVAVAPPAIDAVVVVHLVLAVVAHAAASSIEFEYGAAIALPTTPVLVVAALLLPPPLVPFVAMGGLLLAAAAARLRDRARHEPLLTVAGNAWHAMGPAVAVAVLGSRLPVWAVVAAAVVAQLVVDAVTTLVRTCVGLGLPAAKVMGVLRFTFAVDVLLAPVGYTAAQTAPNSAWALAALAGPSALLAVVQRDRRRQLDRSEVLGAAAEQEAWRARHDGLTGLLNRLAWDEHLGAARVGGAPVGVVLADVDGLKFANDHHGHEVGDRLIVTVARLLVDAVGHEAIVARLGGDEFGVLFPAASARVVERGAVRIRLVLDGAPPLDGVVPVRASLGWGHASDGETLTAALAEADRAMYADKRARRAGRDLGADRALR